MALLATREQIRRHAGGFEIVEEMDEHALTLTQRKRQSVAGRATHDQLLYGNVGTVANRIAPHVECVVSRRYWNDVRARVERQFDIGSAAAAAGGPGR